jgi:hypothetical protein
MPKYKTLRSEMDFPHVLGGGLEPPRLTAYAPQTYVSAISPPERFGGTQLVSRTMFPASVSSGRVGAVVSCQLSVVSCQLSVVRGQGAGGKTHTHRQNG